MMWVALKVNIIGGDRALTLQHYDTERPRRMRDDKNTLTPCLQGLRQYQTILKILYI